jgi:protein subunit release factor A
MKVLLEIKAAEGGDDAKLLTKEMANIYMNFATKNGVKVSTLPGG